MVSSQYSQTFVVVSPKPNQTRAYLDLLFALEVKCLIINIIIIIVMKRSNDDDFI